MGEIMNKKTLFSVIFCGLAAMATTCSLSAMKERDLFVDKFIKVLASGKNHPVVIYSQLLTYLRKKELDKKKIKNDGCNLPKRYEAPKMNDCEKYQNAFFDLLFKSLKDQKEEEQQKKIYSSLCEALDSPWKIEDEPELKPKTMAARTFIALENYLACKFETKYSHVQTQENLRKIQPRVHVFPNVLPVRRTLDQMKRFCKMMLCKLL
jgi:hypothetical protein